MSLNSSHDLYSVVVSVQFSEVEFSFEGDGSSLVFSIHNFTALCEGTGSHGLKLDFLRRERANRSNVGMRACTYICIPRIETCYGVPYFSKMIVIRPD